MNNKNFINEVKGFYDKEIPPPDKNEIEKLKIKLRNEVANNKKDSVRWKRIAWALASVCLILTIALIIFIPKKEKFYYETDLKMVELNYNEAHEVFNSTLYDFTAIYDICTFEYAYAYYDDVNTLTTIKYKFSKNDLPFTSVSLQIDLVDNFVNTNRDIYLFEAKKTSLPNYTLYEKEIEESNTSAYLKLLEFINKKIYLNLNFDDPDIFNIFLI